MNLCHLLQLLGLLLAPPSQGQAQEGPPDRPKEQPARYFSKPVDFWKSGRSHTAPRRAEDAPESIPGRIPVRENVWAQPVRTPDGSWMIYVPPRAVLDFLESPSEESARAYLAWKERQAQKLRKAMLLLSGIKEVADTGGEAAPTRGPAAAGGPDDFPPAPTKPPPKDVPFRITYFKKPSCPHCVSQDAVLTAWLARRPSGTLDTVLPCERPELWKALRVRGTPTLLLQTGNPPRSELLVGLQPEAALEAALARLAASPTDPGQEAGKEPAR